MTREEAIKQLDGAELMLFNREFSPFRNAILMAIAALREREGKDTNGPTKWISVEDRLPEVGKRVLVYSFFDGMNVGWVQSDGRFTVKTPYPDRPTHWMPLPTPPEVEG